MGEMQVRKKGEWEKEKNEWKLPSLTRHNKKDRKRSV
jgi:hypothetical protein